MFLLDVNQRNVFLPSRESFCRTCKIFLNTTFLLNNQKFTAEMESDLPQN